MSAFHISIQEHTGFYRVCKNQQTLLPLCVTIIFLNNQCSNPFVFLIGAAMLIFLCMYLKKNHEKWTLVLSAEYNVNIFLWVITLRVLKWKLLSATRFLYGFPSLSYIELKNIIFKKSPCTLKYFYEGWYLSVNR